MSDNNFDVSIIYNNRLVVIKLPKNKKCRYIAKSIELVDDETYHIIYTHVYKDHVSVKNYYSETDYQKYKSIWLEVNSI